MIVIVNYKMGNLRNVQKAIERIGYEAVISNKIEDIEKSDILILPGVGAFGDAMKNLKNSGLIEPLHKQVIKNRKPLLGICLGMQILAEEGFEGGKNRGLNFLPMKVQKLQPKNPNLKLPHIGWNDVSIKIHEPLFNGLPERPDFYFVHSYHTICKNNKIIAATCNYGQTFVAAIQYKNIFATQFHPEKSQSCGLKLLENFITYINKT